MSAPVKKGCCRGYTKHDPDCKKNASVVKKAAAWKTIVDALKAIGIIILMFGPTIIGAIATSILHNDFWFATGFLVNFLLVVLYTVLSILREVYLENVKELSK